MRWREYGGARDVRITSWLRIGIRIAVLFATYCEMLRQGLTELGQTMDIAVAEGDLSQLLSLWYAKIMGLPVANIICGCPDGSAAWNLIRNGQIRPGDREPAEELERLIFGNFGAEEAVRFAGCMDRGEGYSIPVEGKSVLRNGIFAAVVSDSRMESVIPNVYRTSSYIMEPAAAISYAALMDHRARTGESRPALLLADRNPVDAAREVAGAMQMTEEKLKELLSR